MKRRRASPIRGTRIPTTIASRFPGRRCARRRMRVAPKHRLRQAPLRTPSRRSCARCATFFIVAAIVTTRLTPRRIWALSKKLCVNNRKLNYVNSSQPISLNRRKRPSAKRSSASSKEERPWFSCRRCGLALFGAVGAKGDCISRAGVAFCLFVFPPVVTRSRVIASHFPPPSFYLYQPILFHD